MRRRNWSRLPAAASLGTPFFSFFPFFSSLFLFCFFGRQKWRNIVREEWRCVVGERRRAAKALRRGRRRWSLGLLRPNPKQRRFGLVLIFLKIKTPQNDIIFSFWGALLKKNDTSKTTSFWASSNQNDAVLCVSTLSPINPPSFSNYTLKPSKKPFKNTLKAGLKRKEEEEEEEDLERYFFSFFLFLL